MPTRSRVFRYDPDQDAVVETVKVTAHGIARYPLDVEAMAVHPKDVSEATEFDRRHGVPTEYQRDGTPIMRDAGHYRRYRRLHGFFDRNGFER